jgi:hypothetical protein
VLGVLIEVLCFNVIAIQHRFTRKCHIPLVLLIRVPARAILTLPVRRIDAAGRRLSPLRPLSRVSLIHSAIFRNEHAPNPRRTRLEAATLLSQDWCASLLESGASAPHDAQQLGMHF